MCEREEYDAFEKQCSEENSTHFAFMKAIKRIMPQKVIESLTDIPPTDFHILMTIHYRSENDKMSIRTLKDRYLNGDDIISTAISRTLSRLETQGLVIRSADENDRRIKYVELTDKGKEEAKLINGKMSAMWRNIVADYGQERMEFLAREVNELADYYEAYLEKGKLEK